MALPFKDKMNKYRAIQLEFFLGICLDAIPHLMCSWSAACNQSPTAIYISSALLSGYDLKRNERSSVFAVFCLMTLRLALRQPWSTMANIAVEYGGSLQWCSQDFGLGGANVSIPSAGDAVNHRIDEPVQRCQKTHYHQYLLPILHLLPYNLKERNNVN